MTNRPIALIVEDDPRLSQIFSVTLQNDFETEAVTDGGAALVRLAQVEPALIVLDLHLPGTSGQDVLAHIRADQRLSKAKVIVATADERQANTLWDVADIVLLKPISPMQLRELASRLRPNE